VAGRRAVASRAVAGALLRQPARRRAVLRPSRRAPYRPRRRPAVGPPPLPVRRLSGPVPRRAGRAPVASPQALPAAAAARAARREASHRGSLRTQPRTFARAVTLPALVGGALRRRRSRPLRRVLGGAQPAGERARGPRQVARDAGRVGEAASQLAPGAAARHRWRRGPRRRRRGAADPVVAPVRRGAARGRRRGGVRLPATVVGAAQGRGARAGARRAGSTRPGAGAGARSREREGAPGAMEGAGGGAPPQSHRTAEALALLPALV